MSAPNTGVAIAQFTAGSTARQTFVQFGFIPDLVLVIANHTATNPDLLLWINKGGQTLPASQQVPNVTTAPSILSQWLDANDHLLVTGSTGVITRVTTGIAAYFGGDLIAADESVSSNPVHPYADGTFPKAGAITAAGIELPAAILTNSALYMVIGWRHTMDQQVAALTS